MNRTAKITEAIAKKRQELEDLEKLLSKEERPIRTLESYTVQEKCNIFDNLYNCMLKEVELVEENGYTDEDEDSAHYTWETVMSLLYDDHDKFWKWYSNLCN